MINIGFVDYINALPLYCGKTPSSPTIKLHFGKPSDLLNNFLSSFYQNKDISSPEVILTGSVGTFFSSTSFLPNYGIAAYKNIPSVNLYAKSSLFSFSSTSSKIAVTHESCSSVALLQVLCHKLWKITPQIISSQTETLLKNYSQYDGVLLIGDSALKNQTLEGLTTYDLTNSWYELTKLPFVFACFLVAPNFSQENLLSHFLETSLQSFENNPKPILEEAKQKSLLPENLLEKYYSFCRYRLETEDLVGLKTFRKYYEELRSSKTLRKTSLIFS
ncbi:MqnA/MqnD/SBP family protein [Chlamydiifrater phoenicopteri]|uniref:MqnA/MqnD/SBP family protein n=1 Tax=Chlamydiifrater phoenicopteri TaxID=2681469 RepID=UPI001BCD8702|nr:MqnA/MqnD/SBP family protein [Chlamydiifrater phoenicopteri]